MTRYHLDTDFLVKPLLGNGPERELLRTISDSPDEIEMSALAWYEFCRGPRLPQQEAVARSYLEPRASSSSTSARLRELPIFSAPG